MPPVTVTVLNKLTTFQTIIQNEDISEIKRVLIETVTQMSARHWNPGYLASTCMTTEREAESELLRALSSISSMDEIKQALRDYKRRFNDVQHSIHPQGNTSAFMKGIEPLITPSFSVEKISRFEGDDESLRLSSRESGVCQQESCQDGDKNPLFSAPLDSSANIPESIHTDIMGAMKKAGYHPEDMGMCYGIAWTALLACVRQGGQEYMKRMQYLKQIDTHLSSCADDIHQIYPFFDTVTLSMTNYIDMSGYGKGIGYTGRQEVAFPGITIGGNEPYYRVPVVKYSFIAECTPEMFIQFLQQTRKNNKSIPFGVLISYTTHMTSIGFDGSKWLAVDHDDHCYTETTGLLYKLLDEQSDRYKDGKMIVAMEVVTGNGYSLNMSNESLIVNAKKSVSVSLVLHLALRYGDVNVTTDCITVIGQQADTLEILIELLTCEDDKGTPGFYTTLQNGYSKVITTFTQASAALITALSLSKEKKADLLYRLLVSKRTDGTPGFYMALQNGHVETITTFIQESTAVITALLLSEKQKADLLYRLLSSKTATDVPGFFMALQEGYSDTITAFIQGSAAAIAALSLSEGQKAKLLYRLLASKAADGVPGFFMTLFSGYPDAIAAFIRGSAAIIVALFLPGEQKAKLLYRLLASKLADGTPGFFMTLKNGHPDAIVVFIQESAAAISRLSLSEAEKAKYLCELLASKTACGTPGFYIALWHGNHDAIIAFIQASAIAINRLSLLKAEKIKCLYELLASKRADGTPGFCLTLYNDYPEAITAFIRASAAVMAILSESGEELAELFYGLFDNMENDNKSNLLQALRRASPAAKKAFSESIDQLPLSARQKEILRHSRSRAVCRII